MAGGHFEASLGRSKLFPETCDLDSLSKEVRHGRVPPFNAPDPNLDLAFAGNVRLSMTRDTVGGIGCPPFSVYSTRTDVNTSSLFPGYREKEDSCPCGSAKLVRLGGHVYDMAFFQR